MNSLHRSSLALALLSFALAGLPGCATQPSAAIPAAVPERPVVIRGWDAFHDPGLIPLVEAAERTSPTVDAAVARLRQARALEEGATGAFLPSVSLNAQPVSRGVMATGRGASTTHSAGLAVSWESDLLGMRVTSAKHSATARSATARESLRSAHIALATDVANAYFSRRACLREVELQRDDIASKQAVLDAARRKLEAGAIALDELSRTSMTLEAAQGQLAARETSCDAAMHQLVFLTGVAPDRLLSDVKPLPDSEPALRLPLTGVPASLLLQRPDVAAARASVEAARGDLGVAKAARLPQLSLSGMITASSGPAGAAAATWNLLAGLTAPLFDSGQRATAVTVSEQRLAESVANYRSTALQAAREASDALAGAAGALAQLVAAVEAEEDASLQLQATQARFDAGAASSPDLELVRQQYLAARINTTALIAQNRLSGVALYRALGGAWPQKEN